MEALQKKKRRKSRSVEPSKAKPTKKKDAKKGKKTEVRSNGDGYSSTDEMKQVDQEEIARINMIIDQSASKEPDIESLDIKSKKVTIGKDKERSSLKVR